MQASRQPSASNITTSSYHKHQHTQNFSTYQSISHLHLIIESNIIESGTAKTFVFILFVLLDSQIPPHSFLPFILLFLTKSMNTNTQHQSLKDLIWEDEDEKGSSKVKKPLRLSSRERWLLLEQKKKNKKEKKDNAKTLREIREGKQLDLGIWLGFKKPTKPRRAARFCKKS